MSDETPPTPFRPARPRDERDELNLKKPDSAAVVHERETIRAAQSSMQLESIGMRFEGLDGKNYLGSIAIHFYDIRKLTGLEHVFLTQSTDITRIPELVMVEGMKEAGRALMSRYGQKAPRKTTDKSVRETERNV